MCVCVCVCVCVSPRKIYFEMIYERKKLQNS